MLKAMDIMFSAQVTTPQGFRSVKCFLMAKTVEAAKRETGKWLNEFGRGYTVTILGDGYRLTKTHGEKWSGLIEG